MWPASRRRRKGERAQDEFLEQVEARLQGIEPINPETTTRVVLEVLERYVDPAEAAHVKHILPEPIRELWPSEPKVS